MDKQEEQITENNLSKLLPAKDWFCDNHCPFKNKEKYCDHPVDKECGFRVSSNMLYTEVFNYLADQKFNIFVLIDGGYVPFGDYIGR
jgi:hypothetical protein